jgi:hypothetical protein
MTVEDARRYTGEDIMLADGTDPWLQHPDGSVVDVEPHVAALAPGPCGECRGEFFAPTGNGPTEQGIERCDQCPTHAGDVDAAVQLAALIGPDVSVWYLPDTES